MPAVRRWNVPGPSGLCCGLGRRTTRGTLLTAAGASLLALGVGCVSTRPEAPPAAGLARVSGKVVEIHPASSRLELADAGRRVSVFYGDDTLVKSGTVELTATDVRAGDRVVVSLDGSDAAHARLITIAGPTRTPTPTAPPDPEEDEHP